MFLIYNQIYLFRVNLRVGCDTGLGVLLDFGPGLAFFFFVGFATCLGDTCDAAGALSIVTDLVDRSSISITTSSSNNSGMLKF